MVKTLNVACVQNNASGPQSDNIAKAMGLVARAAGQGAELIALPEYYSGFGSKNGVLDLPAFPEARHEGLSAAREAAQRHKVWVHLGSIAVKLDDGRLANRGFMIDPHGTITARYDKIHLFDVDLGPGKVYRESQVIRPGSEAVVAQTPWGGIGMTICYDLRFPRLYRALAQAGAEVLAVPSAFTVPTGSAHWHALLRARAIECGAYVLAPAQWGTHPATAGKPRRTYGHSLAVAPWGEILADAGEGTGTSFVEIDPAEVTRAREMVPSLRHDRDFAAP